MELHETGHCYGIHFNWGCDGSSATTKLAMASKNSNPKTFAQTKSKKQGFFRTRAPIRIQSQESAPGWSKSSGCT
jgi:hypothetical protein